MINIELPIDKNRYYPKDTYEIFKKFKKAENLYYFFNMPIIFESHNSPSKIRINENIEKFRWNPDFIKNLNERQKTTIHQMKLKIKYFTSTLSWRMVIGLGASHPQETSMTLHHIYGIPYIPGSAVKGVIRHWIIYSKFDQDEKRAEADETFKDIFGTQEQAGKVIFFDAFPAGEINLKIDIMNPHYPDYYTGKAPPADWQNPVPIKFPTVEKTKFNFYLGSKDESLLNKASEWLKEALKEYGIGAKTSIGYGYFVL